MENTQSGRIDHLKFQGEIKEESMSVLSCEVTKYTKKYFQESSYLEEGDFFCLRVRGMKGDTPYEQVIEFGKDETLCKFFCSLYHNGTNKFGFLHPKEEGEY